MKKTVQKEKSKFFRKMVALMKNKKNKKIVLTKYINQNVIALFFITIEEGNIEEVYGHLCLEQNTTTIGELLNYIEPFCNEGYEVIINLNYWNN